MLRNHAAHDPAAATLLIPKACANAVLLYSIEAAGVMVW
jgi:hypothetical protein